MLSPPFAKDFKTARTNLLENFDLCFEITFSSVIHGHHIYKTIWTAVVGQELVAMIHERKESLDYDTFSIGVFMVKEEENKMNTNDDLALVGHVAIEISSLPYYFLKADKDSTIHVKVTRV